LLLFCRERLRNGSLPWFRVLDMHVKIKKTNRELQLVENSLQIWLKFQVFLSY
jgi:alkylated DNA nucleotide flippase Atl1